ncbi:methanobactin [Methylocystis sp. S23]|jgi:Mb-OB3b family methanobactin precursor
MAIKIANRRTLDVLGREGAFCDGGQCAALAA